MNLFEISANDMPAYEFVRDFSLLYPLYLVKKNLFKYKKTEKYKRKNKIFKIFKLNLQTFRRFIELLRPDTLDCFSNASQQIYYSYIDIRGFESYYFGYFHDDDEGEKIGFDFNKISLISDGYGFYQREGLFNYVSCHILTITVCQIYFPIPKKYKILILVFEAKQESIFKKTLPQLIHPELESISISVTSKYFQNEVHHEFEHLPSLKTIIHYLNICKDIKRIDLHFDPFPILREDDTSSTPQLTFQGNPRFSLIKKLLENWFETTTKVETFYFSYKNEIFKMIDNKLKCLIQIEDRTWIYTDNYAIDNSEGFIEKAEIHQLIYFAGICNDMSDFPLDFNAYYVLKSSFNTNKKIFSCLQLMRRWIIINWENYIKILNKISNQK